MKGIDLVKDDNLKVIDTINKNFNEEVNKDQKMKKTKRLKDVVNKIQILNRLN